MPTPNTIDLVELPAASAADVQATKKFFNTVFGWTFTDYGDEYIDTRNSGTALGVSADESHSAAPLTVLYVANLTAAYKSVKDAGGTITKEIFAFPGGRRFHFREPAGNELAVWSE